MNTTSIAYLQKFHFNSSCGEYWRLLTANDLTELLSVSRATAYRIMKDGRLTKVQREILELKCFGLIPGWRGWRIEPGYLIDDTGYRYSMGEIMSIPLLKSMCR